MGSLAASDTEGNDRNYTLRGDSGCCVEIRLWGKGMREDRSKESIGKQEMLVTWTKGIEVKLRSGGHESVTV